MLSLFFEQSMQNDKKRSIFQKKNIKIRNIYGFMELSSRNRTLILTEHELDQLKGRLFHLNEQVTLDQIINKTINADLLEIIPHLPDAFVDVLFLDPPYNLRKKFISESFAKIGIQEYCDYLESWLPQMIRLLKPNASVYICGDYHSSTSIHLVASEYLRVHNRITWQREKGRGAKANWKNSSEDIWFCSNSNNYKFYVDRVKEKRKVIAPYRIDGAPKDWEASEDGNFRLTHPSNIWTDLTVPFWSMPENTEHPTQKPEKLLAKIILASSDEGDVIFDPFLGSGTTSVVAKKLGRKYVGIEKEEQYCLYAEKRILMADTDNAIQGYVNGVFWERNSLREQSK